MIGSVCIAPEEDGIDTLLDDVEDITAAVAG
jgi:hypothetical protein